MESKERTFYSLIILFFVIGLVIGYLMHQPETEIRYINNTIEVKEVPKVVETIGEVTAAPTATATTSAPTSTPVPDFEVKIFDPEKDKPAQTIELVNWKAMPDDVSMRPGQTVLIKVVNYPDYQDPPKFIMGSYQKILGTSGMIVIKFNNRGTYEYTAIIPNSDPSISPVTYAKGSIKVW
ncbi:MAG: hypothetical protein D4R88_04565 [Methanosarcinales archaeon]|nr:MAG: hypothetical protein D4R88_04565 [Methanosarcinales archaeon]